MFKDAILKMKQMEAENEATRNHFFSKSHTVSFTNALESRKAIDEMINSAVFAIKNLHINQTFDYLLVATRQIVNNGQVTVDLTLSTNPTQASIPVLAKITEDGRYFEMSKDSKEIACIVPSYMVFLIGDGALNTIRAAWQAKLNGE